MTLSNYRVGAVVAVSDMELARDFYEKKLGLTAPGGDPDGGRRACQQTGARVDGALGALLPSRARPTR